MPIKLFSLPCIILLTVSVLALNTQAFEESKATEKTKESTATEQAKTKTDSPNKEQEKEQQPMPINYGVQHTQDLKHYIAAERVKPLLAGPESYLTLEQKFTTANSKGVAILLPDWQQGATNPKAINFLRKALPKHGWTTITIQPNDKPEGYPSTALTATEQQEQNTPLITEYKKQLAAILTATMNKAKEHPGIVIVIAQGNNGAFLVDLLSENTESADDVAKLTTAPNALVLLSSYRRGSRDLQTQLNEDLAKSVALLELPLLDLYLHYDHPSVIAAMPMRMSSSAQEMKVYYRQRQLNNTLSGYYPNNELLSQINGWLKSIGW
ncbi:alpha/beta hydrolase family protein [Colwellia sp. D2M02]|uniref:DUF3530 family protein n=1 Tax=Colwellia sp. D2M02 TaxID=2841562 RepID=UPI001C0905DF|nr:DUF3530 family protein [Colwellia sp. D2M02]MBU2894161.1 alpha/beta hydrolase family protein [Colwellia sp. D2M02]